MAIELGNQDLVLRQTFGSAWHGHVKIKGSVCSSHLRRKQPVCRYGINIYACGTWEFFMVGE